MKTLSAKGKINGLTLIELLVVIFVLVILAVLFVPAFLGGPTPAYRLSCQNNLKQIDLCFMLYANDYGGKYPMDVPVQNGGTLEFIYSDHTFPHFEKLKKYMPQETQLLHSMICPKDTSRHSATNFEALNDLNLSYYINADAAVSTNQAVLMGERCLSVNGLVAKPGRLEVTTNVNMNWTGEFHLKGGNVAFVDGHVEWNRINGLNSLFACQPAATNRLCIP